jgi:hypothetical protein
MVLQGKYTDKQGGGIIMKIICLLLSAITMAFLVSQAQGAEWVKFYDAMQFTVFYDNESMKQSEPDIISVWIKANFTPWGREERITYRKQLGLSVKGWENLAMMRMFWYLDCTKSLSSTQTEIAYTDTGSVIDTSNFKVNWQNIVPDTVGQHLYKAVCPPQKKK